MCTILRVNTRQMPHDKNFIVRSKKCPESASPVPPRTGTAQERMLIFYSLFSKWYLKFTIVTHPVGRHFDTFSDGAPSLENRVCFGFNSAYHNFMGKRYGRGGLGKDKFTFALLDWRGCARQRMCIWSDPRNAGCSNSLYYIQERQKNSYIDPPVLTPRLWRIFMKENPANISVPDGVILVDI